MIYEINTDRVKDAIDNVVEQMFDLWDELSPEEREDEDFWANLPEAIDYALMYYVDQLAVIACYDITKALTGCDFEDSPYAQFEMDCVEAINREAELRGITID